MSPQETRAGKDGNDVAYQREMRLLRAGVAALVGGVLLLGLTMYEGGRNEEPGAAPVAVAAAERAPVPDARTGVPAPQEAKAIADNVSASAAEPARPDEAPVPATPVPEASPAVMEQPALIPVSVGAGGAASGTMMPAVAQVPSAPEPVVAVPSPPTSAPASSAPAARPPSPPPGRGFMVQLGVFAAPENAERLRDELSAKGYPAHLQSRVVIGPFSDRKSADAAHARLRGEQKLDGVIVPPRNP